MEFMRHSGIPGAILEKPNPIVLAETYFRRSFKKKTVEKFQKESPEKSQKKYQSNFRN